MKTYLSSILVAILCLCAFRYGLFPSRCWGFPEILLTVFFGLILFIVLLILLAISIYKRENQNYKPFTTLAVCIAILLIRQFFETELFLSNPILKAHSFTRELILRENSNYELSNYHTESTCTETGTYKISNDTIYLDEDPFYDQTLVFNEVFLIERDSNLLIEIKYDNSIDSVNIWKIEHFQE